MSEKVLFAKTEQKSEEETDSSENDEWDDTLLVRAYDKAIMLTKEKIAAKMAAEKEESNTKEKNTKEAVRDNPPAKRTNPKMEKWRLGMHCRAEYSVDGLPYEAVITKINSEDATCIVKFIGYENEEVVEIKNLRPSKGRQAQLAQKEEVQAAAEMRNQQNQNYVESNDIYPQNSGMIPPPPPPFVMSNLPKDETDALSAMLMAWYMSGYHTGYYQGLLSRTKQSRPYNYNGSERR